MYQQKRNKRRAGYQIKKTSSKDINIDRQIWVLHYAMVEKLLKHPELADTVRQTLIKRQESGRLRHSEYITWESLLMIMDEPELFRRGVLEDSEKMRKYRRRTPFVGILTEAERQAALDADAIGELKDMDYFLG